MAAATIRPSADPHGAAPAQPRIIFGRGAVRSLRTVAAELAGGRGVLVLAGRTCAGRPWLPDLRDRLPDHVFATVPSQYPTWESINRILDLVITFDSGVIIAIGGGSVLDTAKVAAARATEITGGRRRAVAAVPTTPGTGAEVTPFATVWDFSDTRKHSYQRADLAPDVAVIDPDLTRTLSTQLLGSAVFDTLAQGMEATWSINATAESAAYGVGAVMLAASNLERLLADPGDDAARSAISLAGLYSGRAIATSRTTMCHAISYPLTLHYGVRHGHACGLTLGGVLRYNSDITTTDCRHPLGARHVRSTVHRILTAMHCGRPVEAAARLDTLLVAAGLFTYRDADFDDELIACEALSYERAGNNPRQFDQDRLTALLATLRQRSSSGGDHES